MSKTNKNMVFSPQDDRAREIAKIYKNFCFANSYSLICFNFAALRRRPPRKGEDLVIITEDNFAHRPYEGGGRASCHF